MTPCRCRCGGGLLVAKRALITGITGQDGSYLAELLLDKGYEVIGLMRRSSTVNIERISHIQERLTLVSGDLMDEVSLINVLRDYRPSEVYNLAAQSFVQASWAQPVLTGEATALGVTRMLDAIRIVDPEIRFYQASSSEMFGKVRSGAPKREHVLSTRAAPTASPRSTATGSPSTTARVTDCTPRGHPVQPRVAATRYRVRHAQGDHGVARIKAGSTGSAPRQPRRAAGLGLRRGLRARDVVDAAAR
jgi:hypothetical protein